MAPHALPVPHWNSTGTSKPRLYTSTPASSSTRIKSNWSPAIRPASRYSDMTHARPPVQPSGRRSEEHTSELQSQSNLVCRLLLEKKKYTTTSLDHEPERSH